MLRAALIPSLRARGALQSHVNLPAQRSLVSTVLLSRDAYESRRVAELKAELKNRGLSTNGRRSELVERLLNDDTQKAGSNANNASGARAKSTLAQLRKDEGTASSKPGPSTAGPTGQQAASEEAVPHPPEIQPGMVVSAGMEATPAAVTPAPGVSSPATVQSVQGNPPGVPPQKTPSPPETFKVEIPYEKEVPEAGPEIPLTTSYTSPQALAAKRASEEPAPLDGPKVVTMSAPSTYLGGGPSHSSIDQRSSPSGAVVGDAAQFGAAPGVVTELWSDIKQDLGVSDETEQTAVKSVQKTVQAASAPTSGLASAVLAEAAEVVPGFGGNASRSSSSSSSSSSTSTRPADANRPLNSEEKTGLYVLAGIVAGGFMLGGLGKKKSSESSHAHSADGRGIVATAERAKDAVIGATSATINGKGRVGKALEEARGVTGKQSSGFKAGAGIVGRGERKDELVDQAATGLKAEGFSTGAGIVGRGLRKA